MKVSNNKERGGMWCGVVGKAIKIGGCFGAMNCYPRMVL